MIKKRRKNSKKILIPVLVSAAVIIAIAAVYLLFIRPKAPAPAPEISTPAPVVQTPGITPTPAQTQAPVSTLSRNLYEVWLDVDPGELEISGRLRLSYRNAAPEDAYEIYLNLYPNSVQRGSLSVANLTVDGCDNLYELTGANGCYLRIPLVNELKTGESAVIYMEFTIDIPELDGRFGASRYDIVLGNIIPIAAIYKNGEWRLDKYVDFGDVFVSDVSDYRVVVSAPDDYTLVTTGTQKEMTESDSTVTYLFDAPLVRDFALTLHRRIHVSTLEYDGVSVECCSHSKSASEFGAECAVRALGYYSAHIGPYPYARLCIVPFTMSGGMEYPGLIMVDESVYSSRNTYEYAHVIAHETAHQWFYAAVGSDQVNEPWVDESLVEFLTLDFMEHYRDKEQLDGVWLDMAQRLEERNGCGAVDRSLYEFESGTDYYYSVYVYGPMVFRELHETLGSDVFYDALAGYYTDRFTIRTGAQLIAAFSDAAGSDMTEWFSQRLSGCRPFVDVQTTPAA